MVSSLLSYLSLFIYKNVDDNVRWQRVEKEKRLEELRSEAAHAGGCTRRVVCVSLLNIRFCVSAPPLEKTQVPVLVFEDYYINK